MRPVYVGQKFNFLVQNYDISGQNHFSGLDTKAKSLRKLYFLYKARKRHINREWIVQYTKS